MAYDGRIMRRALQRFEEDRQLRRDRFLEREKNVYRRQPRLREINDELKSTMSRIIASALRRGADPRPALEVLRDENLSLQAEKRQLLQEMGLSVDCLEEKPNCPLCDDTGYRHGQVCRCLRDYYSREQQKELSRMLDLGSQSFENFSLEWYGQAPLPQLGISPRENMAWVLRCCRRYAEDFGPKSGNLLLTGDPGLGKTFLSACIAREVSDEGYSVVYDTATHIFDRFEAQKFGREGGGERLRRREPHSRMRLADSGRFGHGDDHGLRPKRAVSNRQFPAAGAAEYNFEHQPEGGGAGEAVFRSDCLPHRGGISGAALFWGGHPQAETGETIGIKKTAAVYGSLFMRFFLPAKPR